MERKYAPFVAALVEFMIPTDQLIQGRTLKMRLVSEYFNGFSAISDTFAVIIGEEQLEISTDQLFRQSFALFQYLRDDKTGIYSDAVRFENPQIHPASVGTTGMGLISLCIADSMKWINNAEEQVLETLKSMTGLRDEFHPERNCTGLFRHFIWPDTGERAWDSEFSSIDSGILAAGALFCKNYFAHNDSIALLADALFLSIDWESTLVDIATGGIYLTADSLGQGSGETLPFNEYMLVAWLAKNDYRQKGIASSLWDQHYANTASLPKKSFMGIDVLTDNASHFLSSFVHQFPYYLCHFYSNSSEYLKYMENAMRADTLWWNINRSRDCLDQIWGFGAGSSNDWVEFGYYADNLLDHPGTICSPHIIAGFIPVNPKGLSDLIRLYQAPFGLYKLPDTNHSPVLWRFSWEEPDWKANDIQGVDYASMLFGIASHPQFLGPDFFNSLNDFKFPDSGYLGQAPEIVGLPFSLCSLNDNGLYTIYPFIRDFDTPGSMITPELVVGDSVLVLVLCNTSLYRQFLL